MQGAVGPVEGPGRPRRRPWPASPWWRGAAVLCAGALPALAFPAPSWWWCAYVALVPWLLLARSAPTAGRAALDGWLGGTGYMIAVHHWLFTSLNVFIVVLGALLGLLWAPWGLLVRALLGGADGPPRGSRALAALAVVPSAWLVVETVRSWQGLGGPWGVLGASQWQVAPALRLASVGGVWLVSLVVVGVNVALALLLVSGAARTAVTVSLVLGAVAVGSVWAWAPRPARTGAAARVAVVQPGVVSRAPGAPELRFARSESLTREVAGRRVDLVVWGESSVTHSFSTHPSLARRLAAMSRYVGADVLVNVDAYNRDATGRAGVFKRSTLIGPRGPVGATYDKMRLVPFGEYVPARTLLGWVTSVGRAAGEDRVAGRRQVVMRVPARGGGTLRVGPLICFESAFPDMSRNLANDGAQVLVVQSSTASFQDTWAPAQHASLGALRAAETGRPVVHATLTGVSAVFGPDGARVGERLGTDRSASAVFDVPMARGTTLYDRFGDWAVYGAVAVVALFCALRAARAVRSRGGDGGGEGNGGGGWVRRPLPVPQAPPVRTAHGSPARPGR
ncbi:apolipoprotein N-acyltransferase [Streptomyces montanisoli]|uniref:Apolipoprotein N-acyltransferase n=1 Tax=Streptomyces montanisoli TaxID=2798581 RepID=A0A940MID9_9ACTN|nr:apolipoprotein N-acyltransferase [Streptomyces montanisoli]MBP0460766.1 apolipoprotein N-acyltransferase [Streptomyces montanisoli]